MQVNRNEQHTDQSYFSLSLAVASGHRPAIEGHADEDSILRHRHSTIAEKDSGPSISLPGHLHPIPAIPKVRHPRLLSCSNPHLHYRRW